MRRVNIQCNMTYPISFVAEEKAPEAWPKSRILSCMLIFTTKVSPDKKSQQLKYSDVSRAPYHII